MNDINKEGVELLRELLDRPTEELESIYQELFLGTFAVMQTLALRNLGRARAKFIPCSEVRAVTPDLGFRQDASGGYNVPTVTGSNRDVVVKQAPGYFRELDFGQDASGGYNIPTVTGSKHDVVAKSAPEWFRVLVNTLAKENARDGDGISIAAEKIGGAGKYRFWQPAPGCQNEQDCLRIGAEMVADTKKAVLELWAAKDAQAHALVMRVLNDALDLIATLQDGVVMEYAKDGDVLITFGFVACENTRHPVGHVLTDDGRELAIASSYDLLHGIYKGTDATEIANKTQHIGDKT